MTTEDADGAQTGPAQHGPAPANPLHGLLGGTRGALESALPSLGFVITYLFSGSRLGLALAAALALAAVLAVLRLVRRERPVRVLGGLLAVAIAALVASRTGSAADYFLPSLLANLVSALIWAFTIVVGWPLLGVILGFALRQRTRWRSDPWLVRGYSRASWVWAASFVLRAGAYWAFYSAGSLIGLGAVRLLLGWPMVLAVIALSWLLIRRSLPPGHPGIMHPQDAVRPRQDGA